MSEDAANVPAMETPHASSVQSVFSIVEGDVPDSALSMEQLGSRIVAMSGRLSSAMCRWLLLVAEFDGRDGSEWKLGMVSTAQWLEYSCGIAHRTAVEHVRVARSLRAWPQLAEEMAAGRLSYSQVRVISRVATEPSDQSAVTSALVDDLVQSAQYGSAAQLETIVRGLRTVCDNEDPAPRAEREQVSQSWTQHSQWRLSARLDPERGELVRAALAAVGKAEDLSAADGLVRLAEIGLAALADGGAPRNLRGMSRPRSWSTSTAAACRPATIPMTATAKRSSRAPRSARPERTSRSPGSQTGRACRPGWSSGWPVWVGSGSPSATATSRIRTSSTWAVPGGWSPRVSARR